MNYIMKYAVFQLFIWASLWTKDRATEILKKVMNRLEIKTQIINVRGKSNGKGVAAGEVGVSTKAKAIKKNSVKVKAEIISAICLMKITWLLWNMWRIFTKFTV